DAAGLGLRRGEQLFLRRPRRTGEHGEVPEHSAERVADLVRDAGAEPADGGHLLGADELVPSLREEAVRLLERGDVGAELLLVGDEALGHAVDGVRETRELAGLRGGEAALVVAAGDRGNAVD